MVVCVFFGVGIFCGGVVLYFISYCLFRLMIVLLFFLLFFDLLEIIYFLVFFFWLEEFFVYFLIYYEYLVKVKEIRDI